ncbi:MAG: nickel-dependent lactate racemase [Promethearchaeota archaeon]|nr:MAG: nickel-dependent lactate racemase [Candidatus Lokiarchaeota archaeon]
MEISTQILSLTRFSTLARYADYVLKNAPLGFPHLLFLKNQEKSYIRAKMIKLDYGKTGISLQPRKDWNIKVLYPKKQSKLKDPVFSIKKAIKHPIGTEPLDTLIQKKNSINDVCIVVSDSTRPVPSKIILKGLVEELVDLGIDYSHITTLIATGLHRGSKNEDLYRIIGKDLKNKITIIDHKAKNKDEMKFLKDIFPNIEIGVNKHFYDADLKILTGYVEPHFFFGFSGGRKSIIPGIAYKDSILYNHSAENIASKSSRFGIYEENPLHQNATEIANVVGVDFVVNVCINEKHELTKVLAGDLSEVHKNLVKYQKKFVFHELNQKYDIIICGNGGFPLDLNLYQAVKSMALGEMIVKEGGTIISVNELSEGVGEGQDEFRSLLFSGKKPKEIYNEILTRKILLPDQWEIQILTRILMKSDIIVVSDLEEKELGNIGLRYAKSVESAVEASLEKYGNNASILVLPHGPQIIPMYTSNTSLVKMEKV